MVRYKIIDKETQDIINITDNTTFKYVYRNSLGFPISSTEKTDSVFGIVVRDNIYIVDGFEGTPIKGYPQVYMEMISIDEYNMLKSMLVTEEHVTPTEVTAEREYNLELAKKVKIEELRLASKSAIESGIDITLNDCVKHFDLTIEDQLNLNSIQLQILRGVTQFQYHAAEEPTQIYSSEEMQLIIDKSVGHIQNHTFRFNSLKHYVLSLDNISSVQNITYNTNIN